MWSRDKKIGRGTQQEQEGPKSSSAAFSVRFVLKNYFWPQLHSSHLIKALFFFNFF